MYAALCPPMTAALCDPEFSPSFYAPYESAVHCALERLHTACASMPMDVLTLRVRLKSPPSIRGKLRKKQLPETAQAAGTALRDVAGLRVILTSRSAVYQFARALLAQPDVMLEAVHDYIAAPKPSGYRSLHLIVRLRVEDRGQPRLIPAEIQLRTAAMDAWACMEHALIYKPRLQGQLHS